MLEKSLQDSLALWAASHGVRAEVDIADLIVRDSTGDHPIHLYEHAAYELARLIELAVAARLGHENPSEDPADELVLAALRIRHLQKRLSARNHDHSVDPRATTRMWAALRRLYAAVVTITPRDTEIDRAQGTLHAALDDALREAELRVPRARGTSILPPTRDAPTLADQFLLVCRPGKYGCQVHIRLYRPADRPPVVVIGELIDYHSPGLVEEPGRFIDEMRRRMPLIAQAAPHWVHYLPAEYADFSERHRIHLEQEAAAGAADSVRQVRLTSEQRVDSIIDLSVAELEGMIGGSIRRWHAADYNSATLVALGVRTVDALKNTYRATHPERGIRLRCRRWLCGTIYTRPLRTLITAKCPRCGSTAMQPIEMVEGA